MKERLEGNVAILEREAGKENRIFGGVGKSSPDLFFFTKKNPCKPFFTQFRGKELVKKARRDLRWLDGQLHMIEKKNFVDYSTERLCFMQFCV